MGFRVGFANIPPSVLSCRSRCLRKCRHATNCIRWNASSSSYSSGKTGTRSSGGVSVELKHQQDIVCCILFSIFSIFSKESQLESNTQNPLQISTNKRKRQDDTDDVTSDSRAKRRKDSDDVIIMEFQEQSSKQKSETDADVIVVEETGAAIEQGAKWF